MKDIAEHFINDISKLPKYLYHLVPKEIFNKFKNDAGVYDCRNQVSWGTNEEFIHTSNSPKILKNKVADWKWKDMPISEKFVLLKIKTNKINSKFSFVVYGEIKYYHIWGGLPSDSFTVVKIERNNDGTFIL